MAIEASFDPITTPARKQTARNILIIVGTACLAAGMTVYILIAIRYEERDLRGLFGRDYDEYRASVGMLTPKIGRRNT